jgi:hypothetical protein
MTMASDISTPAREFGPQNIHVAKVIIDGGIHGDRLLTLAPSG